MDSGNSGSFQSSSGEDEFDSQVMNNNIQVATHVVSSNSNQPPLPLPQSVSSYMYHNPLSNYFDHISHPPPPPPPLPQPLQNHQNTLLINSDVDWLKTLRSETNSNEISTFQSLFDSQNQVHHQLSTETTTDVTHVSPPQPTAATTTGKNPRKRSRASRRAPTTVLTTDTSNFRAMVQEFTGIPAPPFASAPLFRSRGFDIFGASASNKRYTDTTSQPQPSYFRRPFPQKVQMGNSSIIDHSIALSNTNNNITLGMNINAAAAATRNPNALNSSLNYYQSVPQTSSHFNLSNPFVSSFPPTTKTLQESLDFSPDDSHIKMGQALDEFCGQNGRPDFISSDQTTSRNKNEDGLSWPNNGVGCSSQDDDQSHVIIRSDANGNFSFSS